MKTVWLYWWMCFSQHGPGEFVRTTYSSRRLSAKQVTAHDRENGWPVGKVSRMKVTVHPLKRKLKKKGVDGTPPL